MSLHKFADMVAKQGRGDDSLLIHMTPDEVQRLQAFAQANGRSLTINPDTGLPEAGMLSDLFKMVAPIALGAFLGPAGFGLSSMMAGVATGGITALATGSLSRGLMAGLGAYGGAGLADSFMNAGANTVGNVAGAMGVEGAATGAGSQAAMLAAQNAGFGAEGLSSLANSAGVAAGAAPVVPSTSSLLSSGFNAATANPAAMGAFAKQNFGNIAAAAAPIMAGAMVPTTTKMPENTNPAYIRQKLYDPFTQTYKSLAPVKASEFGSRSFSDAYTNPQTGGIASLEQRQTTPMAAGGIVALAGGGVSAADIQAYLSANPGMSDADIAAAMNQYGVSTADMAAATGSDIADIQSRYDAVQPAAPAATVAEPEPVSAPEPEPVYTPAPAAPAAPVAPTRSVIEPEETVTAPTGIETLTAAMPPVAPVAPVAPAKPTDAEIVKFFTDNPTVSDEVVATIMNDTGLKPEDIARATGSNVADVQSRYDAVTPTTPAVPETAAEPTGIEKLTAAMPPVTPPTEKPTGIETLTAPVTPPAAPVAPKYNQYTNEQIAQYLKDNPTVDLTKAIKDTNADPAAVNKYIASLTAPFKGSTDTAGGSGTLDIYNQMKAQGVDPSEYYAAAVANDPKYAGWSKADIQRGYELDKGAYELANKIEKEKIAADPKLGYDKEWVKFMDTNKYSINDMAQAFGLSKNEVQARYDAVKNDGKVVKPITFTNPVTGGTMTAPDRVTNTVLPTNPTVNAPPGTKNPYGNVNNPGDKTYNADGSITVQPNIPGRPYGGFSGMDEVKNAYTAGGGSTGYVPKAPKTAAEHAVAYNRMTGDSAAAYKYLMGQGANPTQSGAASTSTGIMRPYFSEGMRYKPKYLSYDKEGSLTTSATNPNAPKAGDVTNKPSAKSINVLDNQGNTVEAVLREDGKYHTSGGDTYDVTGKQIVAGGGMMGYASGGISGDGNLNLHIPLEFGGGGGGGGSFGGGFGDYGAGTPIPMMGTGTTGTFGGQNNGGSGGFGTKPDETGGLYKGPMMPGGLDDTMTPDIMAANAATQAKNTAAQAYATANPATAASLAKRLGLFANGGMMGYAVGGGLGSLGSYSDGGRLLKGPGDGVSDSIPATIGRKQQPARLADGEFVIPARIVSELGNGSTDAGAKKLYAMMDRVQRARGKTTGKNKVAANSRSDKYLPA